MTTYQHQPYTYLIGWSRQNKFYYGVRYAKKANPGDLWVKYFTSSTIVKRYRDKHGDPDIIQIRKLFETPQSAILWEQKALKRLNVENNGKFLNVKNSTTSKPITTGNSTSFKKGCVSLNKGKDLKSLLTDELRKKRYGRKFTIAEKNNMSEKTKLRFADQIERDIYRQRTLKQFLDPAFKEFHRLACKSHIGTIWINNGANNKRIQKENLSYYNGWLLGRLIPKEQLTIMANNRKSIRN